MEKEYKFIMTADRDTREKLISMGYVEINSVSQKEYIFLNINPTDTMKFEGLDDIRFTNKLAI